MKFGYKGTSQDVKELRDMQYEYLLDLLCGVDHSMHVIEASVELGLRHSKGLRISVMGKARRHGIDQLFAKKFMVSVVRDLLNGDYRNSGEFRKTMYQEYTHSSNMVKVVLTENAYLRWCSFALLYFSLINFKEPSDSINFAPMPLDAVSFKYSEICASQAGVQSVKVRFTDIDFEAYETMHNYIMAIARKTSRGEPEDCFLAQYLRLCQGRFVEGIDRYPDVLKR